MDDKNSVVSGSGIAPSDAIEQFEMGVEAGAFDAGSFAAHSDRTANNLGNHLLGEKLEYLPLSD
ncbi:MAG: hypothetical protein AAB329_07340, partial [Pseudomonadota bacterium]